MPKAASAGRCPFPFVRWILRWELRRLRKTVARLRRCEGTLSFNSEQGGASAARAGALAATLGCILTDHLDLAVDELEKAAEGVEPLPDLDAGSPQ